LRFEISVQDSVGVAELDSTQQLVHERFDRDRVEGATVALGIHVPLEILVHELEDEHEFIFGVDNIVERDNVLVLELFHQRDFTNGSARGTLFGIEMDLLESYQLAGLAVASFKNLL
jgi:hypothetical protein